MKRHWRRASGSWRRGSPASRSRAGYNRPMLLALCLWSSSPALAGKRMTELADEQAALRARMSDLQTQLSAVNTEIMLLDGELQQLSRAQDADEVGVVADRAAIGRQIVTLTAQLNAMTEALATPAGKKSSADARIALLEARVKTLEAQAAAKPAAAKATTSPSAEQEAAASALMEKVQTAIAASDTDGAKALVKQILADYPDTRAGKAAVRMNTELAVIGMEVSEPVIAHWYTAPASLLDKEKQLTVLVFWEAWCPHCKEEVPKLNNWVDEYGSRGLQVIALTKVTKTSSDEKVEEFITENGLKFAVAKETGAATQAYGVSGIPACALIKDGVVVWRGHPARITETLIEKYVAPKTY